MEPMTALSYCREKCGTTPWLPSCDYSRPRPDSYCKDFGDAPSLALEVIFNTRSKIRKASRTLPQPRGNRLECEPRSPFAIRDVLDRHPA